MIKEKEILEERLKEKTILFQDAAIYGLSEKVAQMEKGLLPESVKAVASKVNSKMLSKGALDKQKKRNAKEAAKKAPSTITFLYPDPGEKHKVFVGEEIRLDTHLFANFKDKYLKEEEKQAHIERLVKKGLDYIPGPAPEPKIDPVTWEVKESNRQKKLRNPKNRAYAERETKKEKGQRMGEGKRPLHSQREIH